MKLGMLSSGCEARPAKGRAASTGSELDDSAGKLGRKHDRQRRVEGGDRHRLDRSVGRSVEKLHPAPDFVDGLGGDHADGDRHAGLGLDVFFFAARQRVEIGGQDRDGLGVGVLGLARDVPDLARGDRTIRQRGEMLGWAGAQLTEGKIIGVMERGRLG
jgi:hypothetical protein